MTYELTEDKRMELLNFASYKNLEGLPSDKYYRWKDMRNHVVNNCIATRRYSENQLRRDSNNRMLLERIKGKSHSATFFKDPWQWKYRNSLGLPTLRDFAESGDPLSRKIMDLLEITYWDEEMDGPKVCLLQNDVGWGPDISTIDKIMEKLASRTMTEEEYMNYLNGRNPIGNLRKMVGNTHEQSQPIFLDPNSEKGFSLGESQCYRVAYGQNEAGP